MLDMRCDGKHVCAVGLFRESTILNFNLFRSKETVGSEQEVCCRGDFRR